MNFQILASVIIDSLCIIFSERFTRLEEDKKKKTQAHRTPEIKQTFLEKLSSTKAQI